MNPAQGGRPMTCARGYASDSILAMRRSNMLITSARAACPFSYSTSWVSWATVRLRSRARSDATVDSS